MTDKGLEPTTEHAEHAETGDRLVFRDESYQILGACFEVYTEKGSGFLEAVYQECLAIEFEDQGIPSVEKPKLTLIYKSRELSQLNMSVLSAGSQFRVFRVFRSGD